jgi:hypothetical protein
LLPAHCSQPRLLVTLYFSPDRPTNPQMDKLQGTVEMIFATIGVSKYTFLLAAGKCGNICLLLRLRSVTKIVFVRGRSHAHCLLFYASSFVKCSLRNGYGFTLNILFFPSLIQIALIKRASVCKGYPKTTSSL